MTEVHHHSWLWMVLWFLGWKWPCLVPSECPLGVSLPGADCGAHCRGCWISAKCTTSTRDTLLFHLARPLVVGMTPGPLPGTAWEALRDWDCLWWLWFLAQPHSPGVSLQGL